MTKYPAYVQVSVYAEDHEGNRDEQSALLTVSGEVEVEAEGARQSALLGHFTSGAPLAEQLELPFAEAIGLQLDVVSEHFDGLRQAFGTTGGANGG